MKKLSLVLLVWLSTFCLVFGQVSSAKKSLFNEANNTIGKRVPSSWKENEGLYWKSLNIAVGKDYSAVQVKGNLVEMAIVGCIVANKSAQTKWLKESYDTLIADKWVLVSGNADDFILSKSDRFVTSSTNNDGGSISVSVVFMNQSTALAASGSTGSATASASIDGYWETDNGRKTITVTGNTAVLDWVGFTPLWEDAVKKGYVKFGDQIFRNIKSAGNLKWTMQELDVTYNTRSPNVATGVRWINSTYTMSANGQTLSKDGRVVWEREPIIHGDGF
jgi:hypothetical protein